MGLLPGIVTTSSSCSFSFTLFHLCVLQAGTSAALLPDRTALIGTPGPHTWRGTVFAVSTSDVSIPNLHTSSFNLFAPNTTHSSFLRVSPLTAHLVASRPRIHNSSPPIQASRHPQPVTSDVTLLLTAHYPLPRTK